jgi:hypothetical protein
LGAIQSRGNTLFALANSRDLVDRLTHLTPQIGRAVDVRQGRGRFVRERRSFVEMAVGKQLLRVGQQLPDGLPLDSEPGLVDQVDRLATVGIDGRGAFSVMQCRVVLTACKRFLAKAQVFLDLLAAELGNSFG